jgi:hypothetical protein
MHPAMKTYLDMCAETGKKMLAQSGFQWGCIEHLVQVCGRTYESAKLSRKYSKGQPKLCFGNSAQLALSEDDLLYVEGFGLLKDSHFPIHHAWNCRIGSNKAIDVTTTNLESYFGMPFRREYLLKRLGKGMLGMSLLDNWKEDFPLFRMTEDELWAKVFVTPA